MTAEQLGELNERIVGLITEFAREHRGQRVVGSRPVQLQYFAFPVLDGHEITEEETP